MRGHENIIALRNSGKKPPFVFLNDYPCSDTDWFETGSHATVCTAGDALGSIDMRFLVGMKVSITALSENRAKALYHMAIDAGAETVAAGHHQTGVPTYKQDGWTEVFHRA